jgi:hypothetical protein
MNFMTLLTILLISINFMNCKQEDKTADIAPNLKDLPEFAGQWNLQGFESEVAKQVSHKVLFLDPEKKKAMLGEIAYDLEMDSLGLRVKSYDREHAIGYFLYSEIKEHTWVGTWEDQVVRLVR